MWCNVMIWKVLGFDLICYDMYVYMYTYVFNVFILNKYKHVKITNK